MAFLSLCPLDGLRKIEKIQGPVSVNESNSFLRTVKICQILFVLFPEIPQAGPPPVPLLIPHPCEQVSDPSCRGSGKQLHHDAIHPSQIPKSLSSFPRSGLCNTCTESQSLQHSWHRLQISISKENFSVYFALQLSNSVPVTALLPQQECQLQNC